MPTTHLPAAIQQYLTSRAKYALLLTGDWGSGKTHFFRHWLAPLIKNTPSLADASVKYDIIELSVFGLTSIEEVETKIFAQLLPVLGQGNTNLLAKGAGLFAKAWLAFQPASDWRITQAGGKVVEETSTEVLGAVRQVTQKAAQQTVDFRRFVICVDDLERGLAEKGLDLTVLLGYLNSLVDHGFKLIAIANENEIRAPQLESLKEKVIGETLAFSQTLAEVIDEILETEFADQTVFRRFLQQHRALLADLFPQNNLRTFIRFAYKLLPLYSTLTVAEEGALVKQVHLESALPALVRFAAAIFSEYQRHKLSYLDREKLDSVAMQVGQLLGNKPAPSQGEAAATPESISAIMLRNYYPAGKATYHFFAHVFDYLVAGAAIETNKLVAELATVFPADALGHLKPEQRAVRQLDYEHALNLDDAQYLQTLQQVMAYVDQGTYLLGDYITLYWRVLAFDNPLGITRKELTRRLACGMLKSLAHSGPIPHAKTYLSLDGIVPDSPDYRFLVLLRGLTLRHNMQLLSRQLVQAQAHASQQLASSLGQLLDFALARAQWPLPLFAKLDAELFANQLLADIPAFVRLPWALRERSAYGHGAAELVFWERVTHHLDRQLPPVGLQRHRLQRLARVLASCYQVPAAEPVAGAVQLD